MGIAADSLFSVMMSWVRALVSALWALFSGDHTSALEFLGKNWMVIAAVIIVSGLVIDWIVWLIRWQPYHLWARKLRRMLRLDEPDDEEEPAKAKAHAAVLPEKRYARPQEMEKTYLRGFDEDEADDFDEEEAALIREEARIRAEEERARLAQEAYEAEQARLAQEVYEAEQARLAQEAYEAEQARLAQEEYARQMEEYKRQMVQYERDLAEYERQKAEYEAQLAQQEQASDRQAAHRRRTAPKSHDEEPAGMPSARMAGTQKKREKADGLRRLEASVQKTETRMENKADAKHDKSGNLLGRVAKMIEPEEEELIARKTLPPRVDMQDAFRTAKLPVVTPPKDGRRRKG